MAQLFQNLNITDYMHILTDRYQPKGSDIIRYLNVFKMEISND